jgi:hypothetical protein
MKFDNKYYLYLLSFSILLNILSIIYISTYKTCESFSDIDCIIYKDLRNFNEKKSK